MYIKVTLTTPAQAERLKTAVCRFNERGQPSDGSTPELHLSLGADGRIIVIEAPSEMAAEDFRLFWERFRAEPFAFRDIRSA